MDAARKLFDQYQTHDLFVYPSLHDSSGNVVLEALSFGLPVVCLDLGGPAQIVTADSRHDRPDKQVATRETRRPTAAEILRVFSSPELHSKLSDGAVGRAAHSPGGPRSAILPDRGECGFARGSVRLTLSDALAIGLA